MREKSLDRRSFLKSLAGSAIGMYLLQSDLIFLEAYSKEKSNSGKFLLPFGVVDDAENYIPAQNEARSPMVAVVNLAQKKVTKIDTPNYLHSLLSVPGSSQLFIGLPKKGTKMALVDLSTEGSKVVGHASENSIFYGHGSFAEGGLLITTEHNQKSNLGAVVLRDPKKFTPTKVLSSFGGYPHECKMDSDGRTLIVMNSGYFGLGFRGEREKGFTEKANLSWIDLTSGKLKKQIVVDQPATVGHFHFDQQGWMVSSGFNERDPKIPEQEAIGLMWSVSPKGKSVWGKVPKKLERQFLGDAATAILDERSKRVFVLSKAARRLFAWNYQTGALDSAVPLGKLTGLAWSDPGKTLISWDRRSSSFFLIDSKKQILQDQLPFQLAKNLAPGPHFFSVG